MSDDSGIYIHKFSNGYRVVHSQCIENAFESKTMMRNYFAESPLFGTKIDAYRYARKLFRRCTRRGYYPEYGIQEV